MDRQVFMSDGQARDAGWDRARIGDHCAGCGVALERGEGVYIDHRGQVFCRECTLDVQLSRRGVS